MDNHHAAGASRACPRGMRDGLVLASPEHYFVPQYVEVRGWIGVRLDRGLGWDDIERVIRQGYLSVAPKTLAEAVEMR